ncbi:RNA polymerase sigma-70 factor [Galbibacter sp. PAP.153]|uniref:RNA polymerase sigma factor n=1 Tax=Galbibacter sp. PAP.153 TaxID=3104623 RepID=UPI0030084ACA
MFHNNYDVFINGLKKGDEKAYEYLVDIYYQKLYAYAISLINDKDIAEDIVQNVLIKTWQFRKNLNAKYSIQGFLYKSVYNEFINTYQKSKATTLLHYKYLESLEKITTQADENKIEYFFSIVSKEIEKLPPKCQRIFMLSKKEGLTNNEIAEHLSISTKTVEAQISKAYNLLREKLAKQYEAILLFCLLNNSAT